MGGAHPPPPLEGGTQVLQQMTGQHLSFLGELQEPAILLQVIHLLPASWDSAPICLAPALGVFLLVPSPCIRFGYPESHSKNRFLQRKTPLATLLLRGPASPLSGSLSFPT